MTRVRSSAALGSGLLLGIALIWVAAIVAAPYLVTYADPGSPMFVAGGGIYVLGSVVCHQIAHRSFHLAGAQLAVCARCTGLYLLAPVGVLLALGQSGRRPALAASVGSGRVRLLLLAATTPTLVTVAAEAAGIGTWSNVARALAALPVGPAVAWTAAMATRGAITGGRPAVR